LCVSAAPRLAAAGAARSPSEDRAEKIFPCVILGDYLFAAQKRRCHTGFCDSRFSGFAAIALTSHASCARFRARNAAGMTGFTTRKKFCAGRRFRGVGGLDEAKNARIGARPIRARGTAGARSGARDALARKIPASVSLARGSRDDCRASATAPQNRRAQTPSLVLRRSLTACGLALPPDAFIT
jgi:hypothetical protein